MGDDPHAHAPSESLDTLFRRVQPQAYAYMRAIAGPRLTAREEVDDLVQSACREVLADGVSGPQDSGKLWYRLRLELIRKAGGKGRFHAAQKRLAGREQFPHGEFDDSHSQLLSAVYSCLTTPSQLASARESCERVASALDSLQEIDREIIFFTCMVGMSQRDAAQMLDITESNLKSRKHRALALITERT